MGKVAKHYHAVSSNADEFFKMVEEYIEDANKNDFEVEMHYQTSLNPMAPEVVHSAYLLARVREAK